MTLNGECIIAQKPFWSISSKGYASHVRKGVKIHAHRWHWEQVNGPIPEGCQVHHMCENPTCINTEHMEVVTLSEHNRRHGQSRAKKMRAARILKYGPDCDRITAQMAIRSGMSMRERSLLGVAAKAAQRAARIASHKSPDHSTGSIQPGLS